MEEKERQERLKIEQKEREDRLAMEERIKTKEIEARVQWKKTNKEKTRLIRHFHTFRV